MATRDELEMVGYLALEALAQPEVMDTLVREALAGPDGADALLRALSRARLEGDDAIQRAVLASLARACYEALKGGRHDA
jgi:hypothetical protein